MYRYGLDGKEQRNVRVAIRYLRVRLGFRQVAALLGYKPDTVEKLLNGRRCVTIGAALRVSRAANIPLEDVVEGRWPSGDVCPHCGRVRDFSDEETQVDLEVSR